MNQSIVLTIKQSLKERRENYTRWREFIKKGEKSHRGGSVRVYGTAAAGKLTRIGARIMLHSGLEERVTAYVHGDYYERSIRGKVSRNGSIGRNG
jgi:hypothetical protein